MPASTTTNSRLLSSMTGPRSDAVVGCCAALLWLLLCLHWFDDAAPWRSGVLEHIPTAAIVVPFLLSAVFWLSRSWRTLWGRLTPVDATMMVLFFILAIAFRLPMAWHGAAGYLTPDGALSGIVALHLKDGIDHLVFVPQVPYSGSLKSHLTALIMMAIDPARAFALSSVLFFALFVAGVCRWAIFFGDAARSMVAAAGLYVAFAPPFVTRYSLSNDGNYVEVLALGVWALVLLSLWTMDPNNRPRRAFVAGLLLGLALWSHILAGYYIATLLLVFAASGWRAWKSVVHYGVGLFLGYFPGIIWNASHGWGSLSYVLGHETVGGVSQGPGVGERLLLLFSEHLPILVGYESTEPQVLDLFRRLFTVLILLTLGYGLVLAIARAIRGSRPDRVLIVFISVSLCICLYALPHVPGIPRYILFLATAFAVVLARTCRGRIGRLWIAALVLFGALGSWALLPAAVARDNARRGLARGLDDHGIRFCYTDFNIAPIINFLSLGSITCTAKLGPVTTEYFFEHRRAVESATEAAFVPINTTAADKIERRLTNLGVTYERIDLSKPVICRLSRKVDPEELFPQRSFPWR